VGKDISEEYIEAARARHGARGKFVSQPVEQMVVADPGRFDQVLATGVLHYLDDTEAKDLFRIARTAPRTGGRLVTLDGCFVPGQSRISRYLLRKDHGEFVRDEAAYIALAGEASSDIKASVQSDLLRIPYTISSSSVRPDRPYTGCADARAVRPGADGGRGRRPAETRDVAT
jgi:hypothetical protein